MSVVAVACNWLLGDENEAERLFSKVENIPEILKTTTDPLARAVLAAFSARKSYLMNARISRKAIFLQLDAGSQLIEESLAYSSCRKQDNLVLVSFFPNSICSFLSLVVSLFESFFFFVYHCAL